MFKLPDLGYNHKALEPVIDAKTMEIHHSKHHAAYVDNLNKALENHPDLQNKHVWELLSDLDSLSEDIRTKVQNNGGGHANHSFFWKLMAPGSSGEPTDEVKKLIDSNFGSFEEFKTKFKEAALARFGSGWAWLVLAGTDKLEIVTTPNQDTPWNEKKDAVLGLDVWEHAYYLKYQNNRADYIDAWWSVVNWGQVAENLQKALSYL